LVKISFNQHKLWQWLERELVAVLAVGIVGLGSLWASADTSEVVTTAVSVLATGETITVTVPNGGESWIIGDGENITWTASGSITNVMIELQRTVAGAWETIVASTANDGSYPWTVAGVATTTATIRISKVGDASINDTSDAVFIIAAAAAPATGVSSSGSARPLIDSVLPNTAVNTNNTTVRVGGRNFDSSTTVWLNNRLMQSTWKSSKEMTFVVPKGFLAGVYTLTVVDKHGRRGSWGTLFRVTEAPPVAAAPNLFYASRWADQSATELILTPGQAVTVWVDFRNTGTLPWVNFGNNPTRLGTASPRDRLSRFKAAWFSGWVLKNRPANVAHQNQPAGGRQTINPGEVGRFTFNLKAPSQPGKYVETFGTVVEFRQWMGGVAKFEITVVPKSTPSSGVKAPTVPSSNLQPPSSPEVSTEFYDGIESWLRSFSDFFSRLISGIAGR